MKELEEMKQAFDNLTKSALQLNEMYKEKSRRIDKAIDKIQYIIDYGFDYDGFNNVKDLKGLIDMLVQYAVEGRNILKGEDKE